MSGVTWIPCQALDDSTFVKFSPYEKETTRMILGVYRSPNQRFENDNIF